MINLKGTSIHFSIDSLRLYYPQKYFLNFISNLYGPVYKIFKFMLFKLLENAFDNQKRNVNIFTHALQELPPRFYFKEK